MPYTFTPSCVLPKSQQSTSCALSLSEGVPSSELGLKATENLANQFVDGIMIVTMAGQWISASERACQMCNWLESEVAQQKKLPKVIEKICQIAAGNRGYEHHHAIGAEFELQTQSLSTLRIRVLPIRWPFVREDCFLIILEDCAQSAERLAFTESRLYKLTQRETEVWQLCRAEQSRKEMAGALFITASTVKKHMRNILGKKQAFLEAFYTA